MMIKPSHRQNLSGSNVLKYQIFTEKSLILGVAVFPRYVVLRESGFIAVVVGVVTAVGTTFAFEITVATVTGEDIETFRNISTHSVGIPFKLVVVNAQHF